MHISLRYKYLNSNRTKAFTSYLFITITLFVTMVNTPACSTFPHKPQNNDIFIYKLKKKLHFQTIKAQGEMIIHFPDSPKRHFQITLEGEYPDTLSIHGKSLFGNTVFKLYSSGESWEVIFPSEYTIITYYNGHIFQRNMKNNSQEKYNKKEKQSLSVTQFPPINLTYAILFPENFFLDPDKIHLKRRKNKKGKEVIFDIKSKDNIRNTIVMTTKPLHIHKILFHKKFHTIATIKRYDFQSINDTYIIPCKIEISFPLLQIHLALNLFPTTIMISSK